VKKSLKLWLDMLASIPWYKQAIKSYFVKVTLSIKNLHDEIIRCTFYEENSTLNSVEFLYEPKYEQACILMDDLEFKLPPSYTVLHQWATTLHNCIAGYTYDIQNRQSTIFGVFKDDKLCYVVEVYDDEIQEMSGKYNADVSEDDQPKIKRWIEKSFRQYEKVM